MRECKMGLYSPSPVAMGLTAVGFRLPSQCSEWTSDQDATGSIGETRDVVGQLHAASLWSAVWDSNHMNQGRTGSYVTTLLLPVLPWQ